MKDVVIAISLFITICTMWYFWWVKPYNERLTLAMDCMNEIDDFSEEAYVFCDRNAVATLRYQGSR